MNKVRFCITAKIDYSNVPIPSYIKNSDELFSYLTENINDLGKYMTTKLDFYHCGLESAIIEYEDGTTNPININTKERIQ